MKAESRNVIWFIIHRKSCSRLVFVTSHGITVAAKLVFGLLLTYFVQSLILLQAGCILLGCYISLNLRFKLNIRCNGGLCIFLVQKVHASLNQ